MKRLLKQFSKFAVVGTIAFVIDWGTMTFLTEVFGVHYMASTTTGFIVSVIFNYFASMRYVFKRKETLSRGTEFLIFVVLSVFGLGMNNLLMLVLVGMVGIDYRIAKVGATVCVTIYNYVTRKLFLDADTSIHIKLSDDDK